MAWPWAVTPLAGGSPVPSGRTSMFLAAISAAVAGWPKPNRPSLLATPGVGVAPAGWCAPACGASQRDRPPASSNAARTSSRSADASPILGFDIGHVPVRRHVPANDAVEHLAEIGS